MINIVDWVHIGETYYKTGLLNQLEIADLLGCKYNLVLKKMKELGIKVDKLSIARKDFDTRGYDLLSEEYITVTDKLKYRCRKHPESVHQISHDKLKQGRGCPECANENRANHFKHDYDYVKSVFEDRGYELISKEYINNHTPLKYKCKFHGVQKITFQALLTGQSCSLCTKQGSYNSVLAEKNKNEWIRTPANVYIIKGYNEMEQFYKIGITTQTISSRFNHGKFPYNYKVVDVIETNLYDASYLEDKLHEEHKLYAYIPDVKFNGYTECFSKLLIS